ncbi:uncharacterized protein LOC128193387 isoform X2 [Vigna angularis]|uniref:uncharacterized protein LOC128193387 isoform X2 n=1 Tax=Phaseolus angularis TaxID=3914 RepID=UPI0022B3B940|nr:uncharacterized protein LOC128193387 isoform X2 [Vigna angularis]
MRVDSANIYNSDSAFLFLPPSPLLSYRTEVSECGGCWWLRWHLLSEAVMDVDVSWRVWEASHTSSQILQLPMILYENLNNLLLIYSPCSPNPKHWFLLKN